MPCGTCGVQSRLGTLPDSLSRRADAVTRSTGVCWRSIRAISSALRRAEDMIPTVLPACRFRDGPGAPARFTLLA